MWEASQDGGGETHRLNWLGKCIIWKLDDSESAKQSKKCWSVHGVTDNINTSTNQKKF